jgi:hypothetical protein
LIYIFLLSILLFYNLTQLTMKNLFSLALFLLAPILILAQVEKVEVEGAIKVGAHDNPAPQAGTIEWDGTNFRGYDGTKWRILDLEGILDMPTQSRASTWLSYEQPIPNDQWTPVQFDMVEYDTQGEFTPSPVLASPPPGLVANEQAYFKATRPGWYQVNARAQFNLDSLAQVIAENPENIGASAYISIGIVVSNQVFPLDQVYGTSSVGELVAQGNDLQISIDEDQNEIGEPLLRNDGVVVSDVIFLEEGQYISIWVFWFTNNVTSLPPATFFLPLQPFHKDGMPDESPVPELMGPPPFLPHKGKVYASIERQG